MATSGTIIKSIRTGYRLQIAWEVTSQSVSDNASTVQVKVQLVSTGSDYTIISSATKSGSVTINGAEYSFTFSAALSGNQTKTLYTKTVTVKHNSDGTKTCSLSCSIGLNVTLSGTYYGTQTAEGSAVFDTIPRATQPTLAVASADMGTSITISMSRASTSFTHTLSYKFGSLSGTIGEDLGTSKAWTVPLTFANEIPNSESGTCTITCKTYNGSTLIGTKTVDFTTKVPASVVPTISAVTVTETVSGLAAKFSGFVQGKSKLKVAITAAGASGSTITTYKTTLEGQSYSGSAPTTAVIMGSGSMNIDVTVTDSRGRTATLAKGITVIAYSPIVLQPLKADRANADGTANAEGLYMKAVFNFVISPINNLNTNIYTLYYRETGATAWTVAATGTGYTVSSTFISASGILAAVKSYEVKLSVTDYFGTAESNVVNIGTAFTLLDFHSGGAGMAIGKIAEKSNALEIALPTYFSQPPKITGGTKVLWSGALQMDEGETATLSEPISEQTNGIIMVWGRYLYDEAQNYQFNHFVVSKVLVALHNGSGSQFLLSSTGKFSVMTSKYINIRNTEITGVANNVAAGTANGITYNNAEFVLRYVIGF